MSLARAPSESTNSKLIAKLIKVLPRFANHLIARRSAAQTMRRNIGTKVTSSLAVN